MNKVQKQIFMFAMVNYLNFESVLAILKVLIQFCDILDCFVDIRLPFLR